MEYKCVLSLATEGVSEENFQQAKENGHGVMEKKGRISWRNNIGHQCCTTGFSHLPESTMSRVVGLVNPFTLSLNSYFW